MPAQRILKKGAQGIDVNELQRALIEAGYNLIQTGIYDEPTYRTVIALQKTQGLTADGIVGPKTWDLLGSIASSAFFCGSIRVELSRVQQMCPGSPESNIRQNLPKILEALESKALVYDEMIRMAVATVYVETGSFAPLSEFKSKYNTSRGGHPFDLYDHRADLGNQGPPDGAQFKGRGFIQLTGRANYKKFGTLLKLDLISNPELANDPKIAASLLCEYLKAKESLIRSALDRGDLARARKLVNGGSHGLQTFSESYLIGAELKVA